MSEEFWRDLNWDPFPKKFNVLGKDGRGREVTVKGFSTIEAACEYADANGITLAEEHSGDPSPEEMRIFDAACGSAKAIVDRAVTEQVWLPELKAFQKRMAERDAVKA
jgi:hypothetical protein